MGSAIRGFAMAVMRDQTGIAEAFASQRLGQNKALEKIAAEVKWYRFAKLLAKLEPEGAGRPPYDPLVMFKALLLAQLYDLSDAELEQALNDRVSFRRFLGLALEHDAPDHTTLCRFRNRLSAAGIADRLFGELDRQLEARGFLLKRGTMVDATMVAAAVPPPRGDDLDEATDPDARFAKNASSGETTYGYKAHVAVDQGSRLIRAALLTPANVNETTVADALIQGDEQAVYADKGYAKRARRQWLREHGIKDRIMHKTWGGGPPLSHWQKRHNALIAPRRAEVETIFAIFKRRMGYRAVRYLGLGKNATALILKAIAYNLRRLSDLAARSAPKALPQPA
jgi:IS5 family transposase